MSPKNFHQALRSVCCWLGCFVLISSAHGQSAQDSEQIVKVFQGYYDAFSKDSQVAAGYFGLPVTLFLSSGVKAITSKSDMEEYLSKSLAALRPLGYAYSGLGQHSIKYLNANTALFSVTAMRYKSDGSEQMRAGYTYLVRKVDAQWKIFATLPTDEDKLIK